LEGKYNPLDLIKDLERNEDYERKLPIGKEEVNPYKEVISEFARLFIAEEHFDKRRCIMCYGVSNSGKSRFVKVFQKIFNAFEYRNTASKFALAMRNTEKNPSLVVAHEFKKSNFNESNLDNMKQLLEGSGGVIEHKGVDPVTAYHGANFFLTCQYPHAVLLDQKEGDPEE